MDLGLAGRTAVVTGASRGIGLAVTRGLAAHGVHVIAGARRSSPELDQLAKDGSVQVLEVDLTDPGGPARLVALAGVGPDILVNNVGGAPARTGGFLSITDEDRHRGKARGRRRPGRARFGDRPVQPPGRGRRPGPPASDRTANVTGADFRIDGGMIPTW
jgi:hypothetical protein